MLARQFRITKKEDFEAAYRQGKRFFLGPITMFVRKNGFQLSRFGIVVSTKFSKYAVDRNRIKRQIREVIRKNGKNIAIGQDAVLSVRKIKAKTSYKSQEIEDILVKIFNNAKLINEKKK